jgi:predicted hydrocarbon binding protein
MREEGTMPRQRKIEFPFYYSPGKKLIHIVAKIRDEPGALANLLKGLAPTVNLLGTTSYGIGKGKAIFSGFAETLFHTDSADSIRAILDELPDVLDYQVWEGNDGLLVDWFHTGVESANGEQYIMFPAKSFAGTFEQVMEALGPAGGDTLLFLEGKKFAETRFASYREMLGPNPSSRVEEASKIFEALGYGLSTIKVEDGGKTVRLIQEDCFECSGPTKRGRTCAFTRGLAVGSFGVLIGKELTATETQCRLKGAKVCEFVLKQK